MSKDYPEQLEAGLKRHSVTEKYYYARGPQISNRVVDISGNIAETVGSLKNEPGGTMAVYASPKLVHTFIDLRLIDEFRLLIHSLTLGHGTPLFHDTAKLDLELLESKAFGSGAVYARYAVI